MGKVIGTRRAAAAKRGEYATLISSRLLQNLKIIN